MAEYAEELWELMQDEKTHVYMCGLKGMESGMAECFGPIAEKNGLVWTEFAKAMKKAWRGWDAAGFLAGSAASGMDLCMDLITSKFQDVQICGVS